VVVMKSSVFWDIMLYCPLEVNQPTAQHYIAENGALNPGKNFF
jgi:hypothetical protein